MFKKIIFLAILACTVISCQFTETIVINEDGSGTVSLKMDMKEMLAMAGDTMKDSIATKMDTIVSMKEVLAEQKDSIAALSPEEQRRLKSIENYDMRILVDSEEKQMFFDIFTEFKNVSEANNIMNGLEQGSSLMKDLEGMGSGMTGSMGEGSGDDSGKSSMQSMGINFSFENGTFKRDAFIKNKEMHQKQMDSMGGAEMFLSNIMYKVKYTFPRKIVKSSVEDATYSLDGKTITFERSFMTYMKDPDVLDLEIELEK